MTAFHSKDSGFSIGVQTATLTMPLHISTLLVPVFIPEWKYISRVDMRQDSFLHVHLIQHTENVEGTRVCSLRELHQF